MDLAEPEEKKVFENILPLVNIVFLLLIFFMIAGTLIKPEALSHCVEDMEFASSLIEVFMSLMPATLESCAICAKNAVLSVGFSGSWLCICASISFIKSV